MPQTIASILIPSARNRFADSEECTVETTMSTTGVPSIGVFCFTKSGMAYYGYMANGSVDMV